MLKIFSHCERLNIHILFNCWLNQGVGVAAAAAASALLVDDPNKCDPIADDVDQYGDTMFCACEEPAVRTANPSAPDPAFVETSPVPCAYPVDCVLPNNPYAFPVVAAVDPSTMSSLCAPDDASVFPDTYAFDVDCASVYVCNVCAQESESVTVVVPTTDPDVLVPDEAAIAGETTANITARVNIDTDIFNLFIFFIHLFSLFYFVYILFVPTESLLSILLNR